jgi:hypothetical protein
MKSAEENQIEAMKGVREWLNSESMRDGDEYYKNVARGMKHQVSLIMDFYQHNRINRDLRGCRQCGKGIDLDDATTFKTLMHHGRHFHVCSSRCMMDFYG